MSGTALRQETYLPETDSDVAEIASFLRGHEDPVIQEAQSRPQYFLAGAEPGDRVELPVEIYRVLRQVVEALQQGHGVSVAPVTQTLTTQQAADVLGVSRPTVIKLLDEGKIPFERNGTHRRIILRDLLAYRERRRAEQYAALEASRVDIDEEDDVEATLERLRGARRAVAARRRQQGQR